MVLCIPGVKPREVESTDGIQGIKMPKEQSHSNVQTARTLPAQQHSRSFTFELRVSIPALVTSNDQFPLQTSVPVVSIWA